MRISDLAQRPPRWLRAVFASLLLAFALNVVAHTTHWGDDSLATSVAHSAACGYCASLGNIADLPRHTWSAPAVENVTLHLDPATGVVPAFRPRTAAQPRAPPFT